MRRMFGFLIGIMVGWLVGGSIALLLAPDSGDKLRASLRERGEGLRSEIQKAAEERRAQLEEQLASLKEYGA
jgi:gas vesicle protein